MILRVIYTCLLLLVAPFFLISLYKKKPGKPSVGKRWKEHFGITPRLKPQTLETQVDLNDKALRPIWIHAVSVGEVLAITPLIKAIARKYPQTPIVLTTTTSTGAQQAQKLTAIATHRYMPLDLPFAISGFLKSINPKVMLIMETELWPNTIHQVAKSKIPIHIINARLSERSKKRYQKVKPIFNLLTQELTQVLCQNQADADRFTQLGLKLDKIKVTGNLKLDLHIDKKIEEQGQTLRLALGENRPIWIGASTHKGEDEHLLKAHQAVLKHIPQAGLILVPRHPERFDQVFELCQQTGLTAQRRTITNQTKQKDLQQTQVYLADTMGEMLLLIQAADICFIGGSLLGDKVGGHNVLEPASLAKATLIGPSFYNFKQAVEDLSQVHALEIVEQDTLTRRLIELMQNQNETKEIGRAGEAYIKQNQGALTKTLTALNLKQ